MIYTHRKRPYHATAIQWTMLNIEALRILIHDANVVVVDKVAWVKFGPGVGKVMQPNDWAVKGENGEVKFYSDDVFRVKYESVVAAPIESVTCAPST